MTCPGWPRPTGRPAGAVSGPGPGNGNGAGGEGGRVGPQEEGGGRSCGGGDRGGRDWPRGGSRHEGPRGCCAAGGCAALSHPSPPRGLYGGTSVGWHRPTSPASPRPRVYMATSPPPVRVPSSQRPPGPPRPRPHVPVSVFPRPHVPTSPASPCPRPHVPVSTSPRPHIPTSPHPRPRPHGHVPTSGLCPLAPGQGDSGQVPLPQALPTPRNYTVGAARLRQERGGGQATR